MKKMKISLVLLAAVFAIGSAFTTKMFNPVTFEFTGNSASYLDRINPSLYNQVSPFTCTGDEVLCKIIAEPNGATPARPIISEEQDAAMYEALVNDEESAPAQLANKVFLED